MRLRNKLLLPIATAYGLFALAAHFVWVPEVMDHVEADLISHEENILASIAPSLSRSLLGGDLAAIHGTLDYEMALNSKQWASLALFNERGQRLYPLREVSKEPRSGLIRVQHELLWDGERLGRIYVDTDIDSRLKAQHRLVTHLEIIALLTFGFFIFAGFWWQQRSIINPLHRLQEATHGLVDGDFTTHLPTLANDEIGELGRAFEAMRESLQHSQYELETAAEEARASEARQKVILDNVDVGIMSLDEHGVVLKVNPAMAKIFGYHEDEFSGMDVDRLIPSWWEGSHDPTHTVTGDVFSSRDNIAQHADDHPFPVNLSFNHVRQGNRLLHIGIVQDISKQKAWEQELIKARDSAEQASNAKSEFLSRMSHELRTPLNAILGFGQILETEFRQSENEEIKSDLDEIVRAGKHLLELIDEVLDLSRIETGNMEIDIEKMDVYPVVMNCISQMSSISEDTGIVIYPPKGEPGLLLAYADPRRLRQVVTNLLSNAIKYNHADGQVSVQLETRPNDMLRVVVEDTGPGLSAEQQACLFKPFERLAAAEAGIDGTGIGLVICRRLVEAMHGHIGVDSTPEVGSRFWFELPMLEPGEDEEAPVVISSDHDTPSVSGTLLYVEDEPSNILLMKEIVKQFPDIDLTVAQNGEDGRRKAHAIKPDLILMDIELPDMSGIQVMQHLRASATTAGIPVIAISANATDNDIKTGLEAGFTKYLTKPINIPTINEAIVSLLGNHTSP